MMISKKALPRRTFLRGAGVALALPLLDAMVPALSAIAKTVASPVRRFGAVYVPNGMAMPYWTPATQGTGFEITPIMQSLEAMRDYLTVVSGLNGPVGANHAGASTGFLTGVPNEVYDSRTRIVRAGVSADQLIAREFGQHTQLASLEMALDLPVGACDGNLSCIYTNTISWHAAETPSPMERDPRAVFERLFGDGGTTDPVVLSARRRRDRSILDSVSQEIRDLSRTVGPNDRIRVAEYLEAVRDIERRIQMAEAQSAREVPVFAQPAGVPDAYEEYARLMYDLQVLALQADLTRVTTLMMGQEISGRAYPEIGVPEAHHALSHHMDDREKIAALARVNAFHTGCFAEFVGKLHATPDGDGSLLDHIILLYGAGMSDPNAHVHNNLPLMLVGHGGGHLKGGRHLKYDGDPSANLLAAIIDKLGVPIEKIGVGTGTLDIDPLRGV